MAFDPYTTDSSGNDVWRQFRTRVQSLLSVPAAGDDLGYVNKFHDRQTPPDGSTRLQQMNEDVVEFLVTTSAGSSCILAKPVPATEPAKSAAALAYYNNVVLAHYPTSVALAPAANASPVYLLALTAKLLGINVDLKILPL